LKTCVEWNEWPKLQLYALNQAASNTYDYTSAAPPNANQNELRTLGIAMETNEDGNLLECQSEEDGSLRFKLKDIDFVVKRAYKEEVGFDFEFIINESKKLNFTHFRETDNSCFTSIQLDANRMPYGKESCKHACTQPKTTTSSSTYSGIYSSLALEMHPWNCKSNRRWTT
jgi:hypothetical protein